MAAMPRLLPPKSQDREIGRPHLWVATSGGLDSSVLLEGLRREHFARDVGHGLPLRAIHVHHGLQPVADQFAEQACRHAQRLGLVCDVIHVRVSPEAIAEQGMESAARQARRQAMLGHTHGDWIALGHHLDDQVETTLLQWMRGAGLDGLCGMPAIHLPFWRPMLAIPRSDILALAQNWGLSWVEDPSNSVLDMDRNRLRHEVMPVFDQMRPGFRQAMGRSVDLLQSARSQIEASMERALASCWVNAADPSLGLCAGAVRGLDDEKRPWVLRAWIRRSGFSMPPERRLREFSRQLAQTREGHSGQPGQNCELVVWPRIGGPAGFRVCLRASILTIQPLLHETKA